MAFVGGIMPIERPQHLQYKSRSAYSSPISSPIVSPYGSPASSRRSSVSSITSAKSDPGVDLLERLRRESVASTKTQSSQRSKTSTGTAGSSKSGLRSLFGKSKRPKEKKDYDKIILTSRHAAAVQTKLMMEQMSKSKTKTAGVVGNSGSAHSSAAAQEARHPHSGPPAIHRKNTADLPMLTRIISGDEQDEEDEITRNVRLRAEWEESKQPSVCDVVEHESDDGSPVPFDISTERHETRNPESISSPAEKILKTANIHRPVAVTRNSYGGRFHRDETGIWRR